MLTEIRCPKCGSDQFTLTLSEDDHQLVVTCRRCAWKWWVPTTPSATLSLSLAIGATDLDAPRLRVRGREDGYYWIQMNWTLENAPPFRSDPPWEPAEWDGRVWVRIADAAPIEEREVAAVGSRIPAYTGG